MEKLQTAKAYMNRLKLHGMSATAESMMNKAMQDEMSYMDFCIMLMNAEIQHREHKEQQRKLKKAGLPRHHDLDHYDTAITGGLSKIQLRQLRELLWLEQNFNLVLMGPSGVGKTMMAAGLAYDAVKAGYTVFFRTMQELISMLKLKDITLSGKREYATIIKAHLLVIDDMMMFPVDKQDAVELFQLINKLHDQTAIIITTNKGPKEWAQALNDEVLATAMLDRIMFHCEVVNLTGTSYRVTNRQTIFKDKNNKV